MASITRSHLLKLLVVVLAVASFSYAWYDYRFPSWKEEVLLPDGRKIIVKQRRDFIEGYGTRKTWLSFSLPEMGGEQTWAEWLQPTMIGVAEGKVYVVGRPRGSKQYNIYRDPKYMYVAFEWKGSSFERVPFLSIPQEIRKEENIRWCLPGGDESKNQALPPQQWCVEKLSEFDKFPRPKKVDLQIRAAESVAYARLGGHKPFSE